MTKLDIRHLQMLVAIEASANFSAAAARLNITPSALSHRMREAERRIGGFLFYRKTSSITLTPAGRRLLETARGVLDGLERAEKESFMMHGGYETVVRVGSRANLGNAWIGRFCKALQSSHPGTAMELVAESPMHPLEQLRAGLLDLIVLTGGWDLTEMSAHWLFEDELVGLVPIAHPHAGKPFLIGSDFMEDVLVAYTLSIEPELEYDLMFSKYEGLPRSILSVGSADAVLEFVARGLGLGVLPRAAINEQRFAKEIVLRRLTEKGVFTAWQAAHLPTVMEPAFLEFVSLLKAWCQQTFPAPRAIQFKDS